MKQQAPAPAQTSAPATSTGPAATSSDAGNAAALEQIPDTGDGDVLVGWFDEMVAEPAPADPAASAPAAPADPADGSLLVVGEDGAVAEVLVVSTTEVRAKAANVADIVPAGPTTTGEVVDEPGKVGASTSTSEEVLVASDEGVTEQTKVTYERATLDIAGGSFTYTVGSDVKQLQELDTEARTALVVAELDARSTDLEDKMATDAARKAEIQARLAGLSTPAEEAPEAEGAEAEAPAEGDERAALEKELAEIDERTLANEEAQDALHRAAMDLAIRKTDLLAIQDEMGVAGTKEVAQGGSTTVELGLDGVKVARESHEVDGSAESTSVQVSTGGVTLAATDKKADGSSDSVEGGLDLSSGVGVDGKVTEKAKDGSSQSVAGSIDLVYDEKKGLQGVKGSGTLAFSDGKGERANVTVRQTLTTEELGGGVTAGGGKNVGELEKDGSLKNGASFDYTFGGGGGVKATVAVLGPDQYQLNVTIYGNLQAAVTGGAKGTSEAAGTGSASGTVGGGASEEISFSHVMTRAEATGYFGALGDGQPGSEAEFEWVGKLRALADHLETGWDDPSVAAGMQDGESFSSKSSRDGKLAVSAGWGWVKGNVKWSGTGTWTQAVAKAKGVTTVTASTSTTLTVGGGGELTVGGVAGSASATDTTTVGVTVTGPVDLSTEAGQGHYRAVLAAGDADAMIAAGEAAGLAVSQQSGDTFVTEMGVKVGGVGIVGKQTSSTSETVTEGPDGVSADVSGSSGNGVEAVVGDTTVAGETETDRADLHVDDEGVSGTISETETTVDPGVDGDVGDVGTDLLVGGVPKALGDLLFAEETRLSKYDLSTADMAVVLGERVFDAQKWEWCCNTASVFVAWKALRSELASPVPDAEWAEEYPAEAAWLTQARAIAAFMAGSGSHGFECFENVLRHWGELGGNDVAAGDSAADLGARTEWPPGTEAIQTAWNDATARVTALPELFSAALAMSPVDTAELDWHCQDLVDDLDEVAFQLLARDDFQSPAAQSEMVARVNDQIADVKAAWADFQDRADRMGTSGDEEEEEFDPAEAEDEIGEADPATPGQAPTEEDLGESHDAFDLGAEEQIRDALANQLALLRKNKFSEQDLVQQLADAAWWNDWPTMTDVQRALDELWALWVDQVIEARRLYMELGAAFEEFQVSFDGTEPRSPTLEPDVKPAIDVWVAEQPDHTDRAKLEAQYARFVTY